MSAPASIEALFGHMLGAIDAYEALVQETATEASVPMGVR